MKKHPDFVVENEDGLLMIRITPENVDESIEYMKKNSVDGFYLDVSSGSKFEDFDFLNSINLRIMSAGNCNIGCKNIPLMESVEILFWNDKKPLDFSLFPNLRECTMKWYEKQAGDSVTLKKLIFWGFNPKHDEISNLSRFPNLVSLEINSTNIGTLDGISFLKKLTCLRIFYAGKVNSISDLANLEKLEYLEIGHMKKIEDYNVLGEISELKQLKIKDCAPIQNLLFIKKLNKLELLTFMNTNIIDGDLSPCLDINSVGFHPNKRHYSHTLEFFEKKRRELEIGSPELMNLDKQKDQDEKRDMTIIDTDSFGEINISELDDCYESEIQISNEMIPVDLNFESDSVDESVIKKVQSFIDQISNCGKSAFDYLLKDFQQGDDSKAVKLYMEHHLEELEPEELDMLFGTTNIDIKLFLSKLVLRRIGLYPEGENYFAVFDITLQDDLTNYLIAVYFDQNGKVSDISMES